MLSPCKAAPLAACCWEAARGWVARIVVPWAQARRKANRPCTTPLTTKAWRFLIPPGYSTPLGVRAALAALAVFSRH